ncbi:MAG: hypothetical protein H7330_10795 [Hymenobacteraceae bacterium]|nr:hypothetical protein [Hymenobacteraceae bacterium]
MSQFFTPILGKLPRALAVGLALLATAPLAVAQTKVKSVPFAYVPDPSADPYAERLPNKLLPLADGSFLLLTRRTAQEYAVERYAGTDLKPRWSCAVPLLAGESIDAFATSPDAAVLLTYRADATTGEQVMAGFRIDLASGQRTERKPLLTVLKGRRLNGAVSDDGTKLVVYDSRTRQNQLIELQTVVFDNALKELTRTLVDLRGAGGSASATVRISNTGDQYVGLQTDGGIKLTIRRYPLKGTEAQVLGVPVGGVFAGQKMYIFDATYRFDQDGALYAAAVCMSEESGEYYSLKVVKFDFAANDIRYAEEIKFDKKYLTELAASAQAAGTTAPDRLADTYLSDLLLTPEKQVVVVMERKEEEGETAPHFAKELLLFGYNEFGAPTWHGALWKNQQAPAAEGYSGIGYRAHVQGTMLHLVTLETKGKITDLFDHPYSALTGKPLPVRALGLNVAPGQAVNHVKDFTTWLDAKTLLAVSRPAKKSATLTLNKIVLK